MAKKSVEKYAKKGFKRLHTATKVLMVLTLLAGLLVGALVTVHFSKNDKFLLNGQSSFSFDMGAENATPYLYTEEGVTAVCFGQDVSGKLQVETSLEKDAQGRYMIPLNKEGVYTITYTVDCYKFGEKAPNGVIKRIRTFTVTASEEDGRNG